MSLRLGVGQHVAGCCFSSIFGVALRAGRRDAARDPRLTVTALVLLGGFPLLALLPKVAVPGDVLPGIPDTGLGWLEWLGWVWAAGVVLFSLRLAAALVQLTRWRRRSVAVEHADFANHRPEIRVLDGLVCPVAAGVIRPLILVPTSWHDWSPDLRQTVVAHEAAHHARRDPLWRAVAAVTCAVALAMIERVPQDYVPGVDVEEIRTRLTADPFPGG